MNNDVEVKNRILKKADDMFQSFGYSKITMAEIASGLGISKRTLYKHFSNKEHLLKEIISSIKCEVDSFIEGLIADKSMEFIEKLKRFMNFIAKQNARLEKPIVRDLMKNHPEFWHDIEEFRKKKAYSHLSRLIEQGIKSRIFRKDVNTEVVVLAYVSSIHSLINPEVLARLPISADQVFKDIVKILFEGIFTTEGRKKYNTSTLIKDNYGESAI
jgi:AcrR family transcriptional regulator